MPVAQKSSLGAKIKLILAVAVIGLLGAIVVSVKDQPIQVRIPADDDVTEQVVLSVIWNPSNRLDNPIKIEAKVEGEMLLHDGTPINKVEFKKSPFNAIVTIPRGAKVRLKATQPTDGQLDCLILVKDRTVSHGDRVTRGSVNCRHN